MQAKGQSRLNWNRRLVTVILSTLCLCLFLVASSSGQESSHRKLTFSVKPDYPATLKGAGIGGVVRLEVRVQANGTVTQVSIIGGNPILAESAQQAVMKWKYVPLSAPTIEQVTVTFNAH